MINYNGKLLNSGTLTITLQNRALKYGDAVFETLKVYRGSIVFAEDHYFRLMASMRMLRMKIPMAFTLEFFESQILELAAANGLENARISFTVFRKDGGGYIPDYQEIEFIVEATHWNQEAKQEYGIDLYKDHFVNSDLLSAVKSNNRLINVLAGIYARENGLDNCVLLNEKKAVVAALDSNIFLISGKLIRTPALSEGCIRGVVRKKLIELLQKSPEYEIQETEISVFEMQKADEVFLTNSMTDLQPVTSYRKKSYQTKQGLALKAQLLSLYG